MRRRRFVAALGAAVALAGCPSGASTPQDHATETPTESGGATATDHPTEAERRQRFTVGNSPGDVNPLGVYVENRGESTRTITLRITDTERDEVRLLGTYALESNRTLAGKIRAPSTYDIEVTLRATNESVVETVEEGLFDTCNGYGTTVTLGADGSLDAETYTTLVLCQTATAATTEDGG